MDTALLDPRQVRGLAIAKANRIKNLSGLWIVPSQSHSGTYVVDVSTNSCTCPDHETRGCRCKHMWAVDYVRHQVIQPDGSKAVVETMRVTYSQPWPAYNAAQCEERDRVQILLKDLCEAVPNPVQEGRGRRRLPLSDVIYSAAMKTWVGLSGRRATSDLRACEQRGYIDQTPGYNTIFDYTDRADLTPVLKTLIRASAVPLASIEDTFAIDGTGFGSKVYRRWFDAKYGKEMKEARWIKLHAIVGTRTNVITAVEMTEATLHDSPLLPMLVKETAENFTMREVLGDKAYLSRKNLKVINDIGAKTFIPFKSNSKEKGPELWQKLWHMFQFHREEFLGHYHQRSNVEAAFSSIKRKFGGSVRAKQPASMANEALLKCLVYNLSCLVHEIHELGIDPKFWMGESKERVRLETAVASMKMED
jgi:transposase